MGFRGGTSRLRCDARPNLDKTRDFARFAEIALSDGPSPAIIEIHLGHAAVPLWSRNIRALAIKYVSTQPEIRRFVNNALSFFRASDQDRVAQGSTVHRGAGTEEGTHP